MIFCFPFNFPRRIPYSLCVRKQNPNTKEKKHEKITVNKTRILTAAAALVAVFSLAGCGSNAVQEVPQPAGTSRAEEATPETAAPEATATPAPTPEPTPAVVVPTSVTLEQEGGILNNGMTWTLHATVLPEAAADKTILTYKHLLEALQKNYILKLL